MKRYSAALTAPLTAPLMAPLLALCLAMAAPPARATTCGILLTVLALGIYDTLYPLPNDSTGLITVTCIPGVGDPLKTNYTLTLAGTGTGNDNVRSIVFGSAHLYYQVYKDSDRTTVWGNGTTSGTGITSSVTSLTSLTPSLQIHTAYLRMPHAQNVPPGIYSGNLQVMVDY